MGHTSAKDGVQLGNWRNSRRDLNNHGRRAGYKILVRRLLRDGLRSPFFSLAHAC